MVWARMDDEILDNPKVSRTGALGFALHAAAITWCCRNLTDGLIPLPKVRTLLDLAELGVDARDVAARLMAVGLWDGVWVGEEKELVGYQLHDFLDYNPSKAEVLAERDRKRNGKRRVAPEASGVQLSTASSAPAESPQHLPADGAQHSPCSIRTVPIPDPPLLSLDSDLDLPDDRPCEGGDETSGEAGELGGSAARPHVEQPVVTTTPARGPEEAGPARALDTPMTPWAARQLGAIALANLLSEDEIDPENCWGKYVATRVGDGRPLSEPDFHGFVRSWVTRLKPELAKRKAEARQRARDQERRDGLAPYHKPAKLAPELPPDKRITPEEARRMTATAFGS